MTRWKFTELPPKSKKGCMVDGCKRYADYEGGLQKRNGLFRFVIYVCAFHKMMTQAKPAIAEAMNLSVGVGERERGKTDTGKER